MPTATLYLRREFDPDPAELTIELHERYGSNAIDAHNALTYDFIKYGDSAFVLDSDGVTWPMARGSVSAFVTT